MLGDTADGCLTLIQGTDTFDFKTQGIHHDHSTGECALLHRKSGLNSLDWLCYEHCFSACSYPFLTPAVHSMPSAYTLFNTNRQCKRTRLSIALNVTVLCSHRFAFPHLSHAPRRVCGPFRLPTQLQVSKSAELPLVSARATM